MGREARKRKLDQWKKIKIMNSIAQEARNRKLDQRQKLTNKSEQSAARVVKLNCIVKTPHDIMSSRRLSTTKYHTDPEMRQFNL